MKLILKGGFLGGLLLFFWGAFSWMVLPFHNATIKGFSNETLMESALTAQAPESGIYMLPFCPGKNATPEQKKAFEEKMKNGSPFAFVSLNREGSRSMPVNMLIAFMIQFFGASLVTALLFKTGGMNYWGRVFFVVVFALAAGAICYLPYWNWFGFSAIFTVVQWIDLIVGWFLAGLVIAKVTK